MNSLLPKHEVRAKKILTSGRIGELISKDWNVKPSAIADIISNNSDNEFANSFINSVIDSDKLDYLIRDSIHCGVNYGKGIDVDRIIDSLYVNENTGKLCLTEKGASSVLSILATRNIMYQEVYWHKTVRACDAMFKKFFYEYVKHTVGVDREKAIADLEILLNKTDDEFISILFNWANSHRDENLLELIKPFALNGRSLYKPAFIHYNHNSKDSNKTKEFFKVIFSCNYGELLIKSEKLSVLLQKFIPELNSHDIIIERTPIKTDNEQYLLDGFQLFNTRKMQFVNLPPEIDVLNSFLATNKQAYIFCNPKYYQKLREIFLNRNLLGEILAEI